MGMEALIDMQTSTPGTLPDDFINHRLANAGVGAGAGKVHGNKQRRRRRDLAPAFNPRPHFSGHIRRDRHDALLIGFCLTDNKLVRAEIKIADIKPDHLTRTAASLGKELQEQRPHLVAFFVARVKEGLAEDMIVILAGGRIDKFFNLPDRKSLVKDKLLFRAQGVQAGGEILQGQMLLGNQVAQEGIEGGNQNIDIIGRQIALFILPQHHTDIFKRELTLAQVSKEAVEPLLPNLDGMLRKVSVIADKIRVFREVFLITHGLIIAQGTGAETGA